MAEARQLEMNGNESLGIGYHGEEPGLKLSMSSSSMRQRVCKIIFLILRNALAGVLELWVLTYQLHLHGDV